MTLFEVIFLGLLMTGWLIVGILPWLVVSVATRGDAGLANLPLCLLAAVVAGLLVPIVGLTDGTGLWLSFVAALVAPSGLMAARRLSLGALSNQAATAGSEQGE